MNARHGSGQLTTDFSAKLADDVVVGVITPLHQRPWLRTLLFCAACAAGLVAAVALGLFNRWHDDRLADLARQRQCLESFLHSAEFDACARASDAQFVALLNFIAARPHAARATLPAVADYETAHHLLPWTVEVLPLPVSAAQQPARIARAERDVSAMLARRGIAIDEAARKRAWQMAARLLAPYVQNFQQRVLGDAFPALMLDREMQEIVLRALAAHYEAGATAFDVARALDLYAAVGPAMWQAIEREHGAPAAFAVFTR